MFLVVVLFFGCKSQQIVQTEKVRQEEPIQVESTITLVQETDSDGDGIEDKKDKCPYTFGVTSYIKECNGCPDFDEDGICDNRDPFPSQSVHYDCYASPKILRNVTFITNSDEFTEKTIYELEIAYSILSQAPLADSYWVIEGHTDNKGSEEFNLKLSQRRADAVKAYFVEKGIAPNRLESTGLGESFPLSSNDSKIGREFNRRIELVYSERNFNPKTGNLTNEEIFEEINRLSKKIHFNVRDFELTDMKSKVCLDIIAKYLNKSNKLWEVGLFTDSSGSEENNLYLSNLRAKSLKKYLIKQGVPESKLIAKGYGESLPIDTNETEEGRANNRRIEFKVIE